MLTLLIERENKVLETLIIREKWGKHIFHFGLWKLNEVMR